VFTVGGGNTGEVAEGCSQLDIVLLTERYPKLSEFGSFHKTIVGKRGTTIIRNIASQFVGGIIKC